MKHALLAAALGLAACATPAAEAPAAAVPVTPVETYDCGIAKLTVKLLGATAEVGVDGAEPVSLPALGDAGDTYTNGRLTLFIKQGKVSFARGRMAAQECAAAS
jgi:membrane-bound inhibitor of C-type lysozyme